MKKAYLLFLLLFSFTLSVCAQTSGTKSNDEQTTPQGGKRLIVFYSWSGNSRAIANNLKSIIDGDIVEITPTAPYTRNYNQMLNVARQEIVAIDNTGTYPAINNPISDIAGYDAVFIIYPLWWSRMATPMQAFLRNQSTQLRGKTLALVCTSGSSDISQTVADARRLCPESIFTEALHIRSATVGNAGNQLSSWLQKIGFTADG
jgi:flavodoxin